MPRDQLCQMFGNTVTFTDGITQVFNSGNNSTVLVFNHGGINSSNHGITLVINGSISITEQVTPLANCKGQGGCQGLLVTVNAGVEYWRVHRPFPWWPTFQR